MTDSCRNMISSLLICLIENKCKSLLIIDYLNSKMNAK